MNERNDNCIIFVCVGNTCRSPMAEALLKSELKRLKISDITVSSAGLRGGGKPINLSAAKTLANRGLELSNFTSKLIDEHTFSARAVIAMTQEICEELKKIQSFGLEAGKLKEKLDNIFSFKELVGYDIPDPYGLGEREYSRAFSQIDGGMSAIIDRFATPIPVQKEEKPLETTSTTATTEKPKTARKPRTATAKKPSSTSNKSKAKTTATKTKSAPGAKKSTNSAGKKPAAKKTPSKSATKTAGVKKKTATGAKKSVKSATKKSAAATPNTTAKTQTGTPNTTKTTTKKSVEKPKK